jgi:hypothetical protein
MKKKLRQIVGEGKTEIYTKPKSKEQKLGDAPLDPADEIRLGGKTEVELRPVIHGKAPFSQNTLHAKSQPHDKAVPQEEIDKLIAAYAGHNAEKRKDFINWLQNGAGVPENYAKRNRAGLHYNKEEACLPGYYYKEELGSLLDEGGVFNDCGLSEEFKDKATKLFTQALETRVQEELKDPFRQKLMELLANYSPHPFNDDTIPVMERLALEVEWLEKTLAEIEASNQELRSENHLREEQLFIQNFTGTKTRSSSRKSSIEETMLEPDEANASALFNQEEKHNNGVRRYLNNEGRLWGVPNLGD